MPGLIITQRRELVRHIRWSCAHSEREHFGSKTATVTAKLEHIRARHVFARDMAGKQWGVKLLEMQNELLDAAMEGANA